MITLTKQALGLAKVPWLIYITGFLYYADLSMCMQYGPSKPLWFCGTGTWLKTKAVGSRRHKCMLCCPQEMERVDVKWIWAQIWIIWSLSNWNLIYEGKVLAIMMNPKNPCPRVSCMRVFSWFPSFRFFLVEGSGEGGCFWGWLVAVLPFNCKCNSCN